MQFTISADHPSLPGHFPGHPIVPGVVILSHVLSAIESHVGEQKIIGIRRLKFVQQVLPGQVLRLDVGALQPGRIAFKCWVGESLAVDGQVALAS
jgi:3-hydroxymyristoyl/3-hydroxydecanoyl-(acyl carrier protein) dehydratase